MRKSIVMVCLVAVALSGCASHPAEFVPPEANRDELVTTIIRQGEEPATEAAPPRRPDTFLEKVGGYTITGAAVAGACIVAAPLIVGLLILKAKAGSASPS